MARETARRLDLSTDRVWMLVAWLLPGAAVLLSRMPVGDLSYQIRAGQLMLASHSILRTDPFTFTVFDRAWLDQQWGAQVILRALYSAGGWAGLVVVRAAIVAVAFGIVFRWSCRESGDALIGACLSLGGLLVAVTVPGSIAMRPQLLVVPLFVLSVRIVRDREVHPGRLWWLPAIAAAWANLHGSFVLAPLLALIALVADAARRAPSARRVALVAVACVIAPFANPWGPRVYTYVLDVSTSPIVRDVIDEWQPLWKQGGAGAAFLVAAVGLIALVRFRGERRPTLEELLGVGAFTALAVASGRNVLWWSLFVPPVLAGLVRGRTRRAADRTPLAPLVAAALVTLVALGLGRALTTRPTTSLLSEIPTGVTSTLDRVSSPGTRVFDGWWGWWFEFATPDVPMFVDSRAELFPKAVWDDYFRISEAAPGWNRALDRWRIDVVVASWDHQGPLIAALGTDSAWREIYRDGFGVVFDRS